jgi:hypothetical protein
MSCYGRVEAPFVVINADDYYGPEAFQKIYNFLATTRDDGKYRFAMVGYLLRNTLTDEGCVARGICSTDDNGHLTNIVERTRIERKNGMPAFSEDGGETWAPLRENDIVSMNFWGFSPAMLAELKARFPVFLKKNLSVNPLKCEFFLPSVVDELVKEGKATVSVLKTSNRWYGVTYKEDKPRVMKAFAEMRARGMYPGKF